MPIDRSGPVPKFYDYVTNNAIVTRFNSTNQDIIESLGIASWIDIPSFQRGVAWDLTDIQNFLESNSILFGNVILADFKCIPGFESKKLPCRILVDGLQRFSIGTILLTLIDEKVFNPSGPYHVAHYSDFSTLATWVRSFSVVYRSNDQELRNHPRKAISDNYNVLRHEVEKYFEKEIQNGNGKLLAKLIINTFLGSQIAIDIYYHFNNIEELMNTFLGINTVRVDLSNVDLLRAIIIDNGTRSGWTSDEINTIENSFTDVFTSENSKDDNSLKPFVSVILSEINTNGDKIFPSWNSKLDIKEVEVFLNFIKKFKFCKGKNGFYDEIRECGANAFAIILIYYYISLIKTGTSIATPSFICGGKTEDKELYIFLRAIYRVYILGSIGRIRHYAEHIISDSTYLGYTLIDIAEQISVNEVKKSLSTDLDLDILKANIEEFNRDKSKRIFNAMLLPDKASGIMNFQPLSFGRTNSDFNVDHLIPDSLLGNNQIGQTIRNFAPLPQPMNNTAKNTPCALKLLSSEGVYNQYITSSTCFVHPYCNWLIAQAKSIPPKKQNCLNKAEYLEKNYSLNNTVKIGDDRIAHIADELLKRL